jgi:hypothetical protein
MWYSTFRSRRACRVHPLGRGSSTSVKNRGGASGVAICVHIVQSSGARGCCRAGRRSETGRWDPARARDLARTVSTHGSQWCFDASPLINAHGADPFLLLLLLLNGFNGRAHLLADALGEVKSGSRACEVSMFEEPA